jgi:putative nucleotidyltransferase with HDIG domain
VLRWANSAYSQPETPVTSVKRAVVRIGTANILKLAVGQHLLASFMPSNAGKDLAENELWRHGVAAALVAEGLEEYHPKAVPGLSFTAALLHDIGKLLTGRRLGYSALQEILRSIVAQKNISSVEAEREFMQTDHAEVGAAMARHWQFPEELVSAIEKHHQADAESDPVLDVVKLADTISKSVDAADGMMPDLAFLAPQVQRLRLTPAKVKDLLLKVKVSISNSDSLWQME